MALPAVLSSEPLCCAHRSGNMFCLDCRTLWTCPAVAKRVCEAIIADDYKSEGALFCGTGIGMSITANKFPGIYAGVAHDNYACERLRLSNNANLICMGARIIGPELAKKILREWCTTSFKGGPSADKVNLIREYEKELFK